MLKASGPQKIGYQGKRITVLEQPVSNGEASFTAEIVSVRNAVAVLGVFTKEGGSVGEDYVEYLLLKHRRFPVDQLCKEPPLWEVCAGVIDPEDVGRETFNGLVHYDTAARELEEETGYVNGQMHYLGEFFTSPGISTESIQMFVVFNPVLKEQKLTEHEKGEIEVVRVSESIAIQMVLHGTIKDMKTANIIMRSYLIKLQLMRQQMNTASLFISDIAKVLDLMASKE